MQQKKTTPPKQLNKKKEMSINRFSFDGYEATENAEKQQQKNNTKTPIVVFL